MRTTKTRLTVTIDPDLVQAGHDAVAHGTIDSLSAWVNLALTERAEKDRRLRALGDAIAGYEAEFGTITTDELAAQARADRAEARVVRGAGRTAARKTRSHRRGAA